MFDVFTIIHWIVGLIFLMTSGFFFYIFIKFTRETHKNTDWSKGSSWIIGALPYWIIKLIWAFLGLLCLSMFFGYLYNVILLGEFQIYYIA